MDRNDLFAFAKARGWTPGTKLTDAQKTTLRTALKNRLTMEEIAAARVVLDGSSRPMTAMDAAEALMEELS